MKRDEAVGKLVTRLNAAGFEARNTVQGVLVVSADDRMICSTDVTAGVVRMGKDGARISPSTMVDLANIIDTMMAEVCETR